MTPPCAASARMKMAVLFGLPDAKLVNQLKFRWFVWQTQYLAFESSAVVRNVASSIDFDLQLKVISDSL